MSGFPSSKDVSEGNTAECLHWNAKQGFILSGSPACSDSPTLIFNIPTKKKNQKSSGVHRAGLLGLLYFSESFGLHLERFCGVGLPVFAN